MQPIEGVDLAVLAEAERKNVLKEKTDLAGSKIRGIIYDLEKWEKEKKSLMNQVDKLVERIKKATDKLKQIQAGNWEILQLEEQKPPEGRPATEF